MPRRRGSIGKLYAQRIHAKRRAAERYGVALTRHGYRSLVAQIQAGDARFLHRQSNRVSHWSVDHGGVSMHAVYDSLRKSIVTFLPREPVEHVDT